MTSDLVESLSMLKVGLLVASLAFGIVGWGRCLLFLLAWLAAVLTGVDCT